MSRSMHRERGLTLVELLVALTIGLVITLAASALYLATRETARSVQAIGDINETGKIALDMIGREIQKAGFFPAQFASTTSDRIIGSYYNGKAGAKPIFDTGIAGCDGAAYDPTAKACASAGAGTPPDGIVLNYFATPEFGATSLLGNANDCNRQPVSNDADNTARAAAGTPLFVSNRFSLVASSYTGPDGVTISTKSLACQGNGADTAAAQPMLMGVEDMVIRYGIYSTDTSQSPDKFLSAAGINGQGLVGTKTPWQRVTAVKVCVLIRSLDSARQEDKSTAKRTYRDCRNTDVTPPASDRFIHKRFERIYAVRNNLNDIL